MPPKNVKVFFEIGKKEQIYEQIETILDVKLEYCRREKTCLYKDLKVEIQDRGIRWVEQPVDSKEAPVVVRCQPKQGKFIKPYGFEDWIDLLKKHAENNDLNACELCIKKMIRSRANPVPVLDDVWINCLNKDLSPGTVQILIHLGVDPELTIHQADEGSEWSKKAHLTALHCAAEQGMEDLVNWLLDQKGVSVNKPDNLNLTPIFYSKTEGIMQLLIKKKADINVVGKTGLTLLHQICNDCPWLQCTQKDQLLQMQEASRSKVSTLLNAKAHINAVLHAQGGMTPLHMAAKGCNRIACEVLLQNGADANKKDNRGSTALHILAERRFANVDFVVGKGWVTEENEGAEMVRVMLRNNLCDPTISDKSGRNPEEVAQAKKNEKIVDMFRTCRLFQETENDDAKRQKTE